MSHETGSVVTCEIFDRWLDDGTPAGPEAAAFEAHAAGCVRCSSEWAAARAVESELRHAIVPAPHGFTEAVMARVATASAVTSEVRVQELASVMPWWSKALAQPATVLAFTVAALALWRREALMAAGIAFAQHASAWLSTAVNSAPPSLPPTFGLAETLARPDVMLGFVLAIAPALAWGSWQLWRWGEERVAGR